jgi:hypothetical protein
VIFRLKHGYFKVLARRKATVDEGKALRIAQELEKQAKEEKEYRQKRANDPDKFILPYFKTPIERSPYAYIVIARRNDWLTDRLA